MIITNSIIIIYLQWGLIFAVITQIKISRLTVAKNSIEPIAVKNTRKKQFYRDECNA